MRKSVVVKILAKIGVDVRDRLVQILADHRTIHLNDVRRGNRRVGRFERARVVHPATQTFELLLRRMSAEMGISSARDELRCWRLLERRSTPSGRLVTIADRTAGSRLAIRSIRNRHRARRTRRRIGRECSWSFGWTSNWKRKQTTVAVMTSSRATNLFSMVLCTDTTERMFLAGLDTALDRIHWSIDDRAVTISESHALCFLPFVSSRFCELIRVLSTRVQLQTGSALLVEHLLRLVQHSAQDVQVILSRRRIQRIGWAENKVRSRGSFIGPTCDPRRRSQVCSERSHWTKRTGRARHVEYRRAEVHKRADIPDDEKKPRGQTKRAGPT